MTNNIKSIAVAIAVLIILFPLGYSVVRPIVSQGTETDEPFLDVPEGKGKCVREKPYMRYRHMELLKEIREEAVREGKRGQKGINGEEITLNNCMKCHGSRKRFCNQCHEAVNLYPNCFRCHFDPDSVTTKEN